MKCLLCYQPVAESDREYHPKCAEQVFGVNYIPEIDIDIHYMADYARKIVNAHKGITGVQPKLSLWLAENIRSKRFTIVDETSNYIIKPQSEIFQALPENEDVCMHLADTFGIKTAKHALVRLKDGSLAYISKRFDRNGTFKKACEDLCQLTENLTEYKYRGSYEKTGRTIRNYSSQSGLDALRYFELLVFSFISGNADMHLKNFSMLEEEDGLFILSPAYDLVCTALVIKNEPEQMSLTVNGRKNKISKKDFDALAESLKLNEKQVSNTYRHFSEQEEKALSRIESSFLPKEHKEQLSDMLHARIRLFNP